MTELKQDNSLAANAPEAPSGTGRNAGRGRTTHRTTKKRELIRLLGGRTGADVARLSDKLGWQAHSVRAALSGLRKEGYDIQKTPGPGGKASRYRILSGLASAHAGGAETGK